MKYKKLLITGFEPFGGESVNPSWEAVCRLPDQIAQYELTKLQIPTVFGLAAQTVLDAAYSLQPDVILCIGQAGGRDKVTPEVIGINLRECTIADNAGNRPVNVPVVENGPAAYFSTVPVREIVSAMEEKGFPSKLSYSAGAFVCNDVLYSLLHHYQGTRTRVGFIHVPFLPQQAKGECFGLPLEQTVKALCAAVEALGDSMDVRSSGKM